MYQRLLQTFYCCCKALHRRGLWKSCILLYSCGKVSYFAPVISRWCMIYAWLMARGIYIPGRDIWDRIEGSSKIGQTRNAWYLLLRAFNSCCRSLVTGVLRLRLGTKLCLHPNLKCFQYCLTSCRSATCEAIPIPTLLSFVWLAANRTCTKIL